MKLVSTLFLALVAIFAMSALATEIQIPGLDIGSIADVSDSQFEQLLAQLSPEDRLNAPSLGEIQLAAKFSGMFDLLFAIYRLSLTIIRLPCKNLAPNQLDRSALVFGLTVPLKR